MAAHEILAIVAIVAPSAHDVRSSIGRNGVAKGLGANMRYEIERNDARHRWIESFTPMCISGNVKSDTGPHRRWYMYRRKESVPK